MATLLAPSPISTVPAARDHFVQFYERDDALVGEVARYLRNGLDSGCAAIALATPQHLEAIRAAWSAEGYDPAEAERRGQLVLRDAASLLPRFMRDGVPDPARFDATIGALMREALERFGDVVAFGELIALLFAEGRQTAAVQLEDLWNRLAQAHRFALFCAYPLRDFATSQATDAYRHVCSAHSHIVLAEGFHAARTPEEQVRAIADLQQKAAALAHELALRKATEERLAERERELADFVENAVVGLHRVGPDGTILWANRAELDMLGYAEHEYIGRNIADFHTDAALLDRILDTLAHGEALREQPATMRCKDGSLRHVLVSSNALIRDGGLVHTRCITRDVTDRWRAQEALRERSAILHLALQGSRAGYWVGEFGSGRMRCSSELASLLGMEGPFEGSWEEFVDRVHPDDRAGFRRSIDEAVRARGRVSAELRLGAADQWRRYEMRGEPVFDDQGNAIRFYGICFEV